MGPTLVIHPGALGDVLLAIPALRALRKRHPDARITLAAQSPVGDLLRALAVIDTSVRFERLGLDRLFVGADLDASIDVLRHAGRVVCWFGARDPAFVRELAAIAPGAIVATPWTSDAIVWEHLLATIGEDRDGADRTPVRVPPSVVADGRRALAAAGWDGAAPLVVVHPGAGGVAKRWSIDGYADVLADIRSRFRVALVVHEGPADREPAQALVARLDPPVGKLDNPPLPVLAGALAHARAFLGNDSGVSHLAAAAGAPSVVVATPEARAWAPWSPSVRPVIVSTRDLVRGDVARVATAVEDLLG